MMTFGRWIAFGMLAPDDASTYSVDLVHPSPRGAALIGELVASVIARNGR